MLGLGGSLSVGLLSLLAGRGAGVVRLRVNELTERKWYIVRFDDDNDDDDYDDDDLRVQM